MTCDAVGGVWQYATDLADALASAGVEVVLALLGPEPAIAEHANERIVHTGLPLDWLASGPVEVLAAGRTIAALAAERDVDLVHLNAPALAAADAFHVPVVAAAHGCVGTWFGAQGERAPADLAWHEKLTRAGLLAADAIVAPSGSYAAVLQRHYALPETPLVVHNGRAAIGGDRDRIADHVFTAGRLWDRVKNTALLDAVAALLPVPFHAAGPTVAPHGETIAPRYLRLLGTLDPPALASEYCQAPIFVSAASFEPFGLAVLEAAQAGCPLVLSGIDTFRELWTGAALIVPDDDAQAYADAIGRIRTEPGLREHLSQASRQRAARYTPAAMAAGMLAIYRALVAPPERVAA